MTLRRFPSGKMAFSPDKTTSRSISSDKNHDPPDGKPLRLSRQNHFGRQCATGSVYWHLPAKVRLKKAHFGKPPLTECTLRRPPCQSELAEACESTSKTKAPVAATSLRAKTQKPTVSENKMSFAESEEACWRAKTKSSTRTRKTPFGS